MKLIPLRGHPNNVLPRLTGMVSELIGAPPDCTFCFGCACDTSKAREEHDCERLFPVYEAEERHHAVQVEEALSKAFAGRPNYVEDVAFSDGTDALAGPCFVYVAVWKVGSDKRIKTQ